MNVVNQTVIGIDRASRPDKTCITMVESGKVKWQTTVPNGVLPGTMLVFNEREEDILEPGEMEESE